MKLFQLKNFKKYFENPKFLAIITAISCLIGGTIGYLSYIYKWI